MKSIIRIIVEGILGVIAFFLLAIAIVGILASSESRAANVPKFTQTSVQFYDATIHILHDHERHVICYTPYYTGAPLTCVADPEFMKPKAIK